MHNVVLTNEIARICFQACKKEGDGAQMDRTGEIMRQ